MGDGKTNDKKKLSDQVRHLPALVLPINEIPYTVNGKKVSYFSFSTQLERS